MAHANVDIKISVISKYIILIFSSIMHYPAAPVIRNEILDENSDSNYVQAGKIKGKIKKKPAEVLKDSTNQETYKLKSMK